jgi:hypothetical protein
MKILRACVLALAAIACAAPANPQQQNPAAQPTPAQLQQQIDELKQRLADAELKAKSAALDKDHIQRYEAYYEKVLNTQLWSLGILTAIILGLATLATKFSLDIVERRTQDAVNQVKTQISKEYGDSLAREIKNLRDTNAADIKALTDTLSQKITEASNDMLIRARWTFAFSQALAFAAAQQFEESIRNFRKSVQIYKDQRPRNILRPNQCGIAVGNTLRMIERLHGAKLPGENQTRTQSHALRRNARRTRLRSTAPTRIRPTHQRQGKRRTRPRGPSNWNHNPSGHPATANRPSPIRRRTRVARLTPKRHGHPFLHPETAPGHPRTPGVPFFTGHPEIPLLSSPHVVAHPRLTPRD